MFFRKSFQIETELHPEEIKKRMSNNLGQDKWDHSYHYHGSINGNSFKLGTTLQRFRQGDGGDSYLIQGNFLPKNEGGCTIQVTIKANFFLWASLAIILFFMAPALITGDELGAYGMMALFFCLIFWLSFRSKCKMVEKHLCKLISSEETSWKRKLKEQF